LFDEKSGHGTRAGGRARMRIITRRAGRDADSYCPARADCRKMHASRSKCLCT
jgi:hypothetical protein